MRSFSILKMSRSCFDSPLNIWLMFLAKLLSSTNWQSWCLSSQSLHSSHLQHAASWGHALLEQNLSTRCPESQLITGARTEREPSKASVYSSPGAIILNFYISASSKLIWRTQIEVYIFVFDSSYIGFSCRYLISHVIKCFSEMFWNWFIYHKLT